MRDTVQLRADCIVKSYKKRMVVRGVSLSLSCGSVVGLLGPNGAGKTTCFYMMAGLVTPDQGEVYLGDQCVTHRSLHFRAQLGLSYLPQEACIFRNLSVEDNIRVVLQLQSLSSSQIELRLEQLLKEFSIEPVRKVMGVSLSGGERRRVEIARTLAMSPKFILLDEPFAGVDPIVINDIKGMIQGLKAQGIGVLITDHNVRETLDVCDFAYIMHAGQVIASGDTAQIVHDPLVRETYLGESFLL